MPMTREKWKFIETDPGAGSGDETTGGKPGADPVPGRVV